MRRALIILILAATATAGDVGGSFSTGIFTGTPFWNKDNISSDVNDPKYINHDDMFWRSVNHLRLYGNNFNGFSFRLNAVRSDGLTYQEEKEIDGVVIPQDNRLTNTKIYEIFAQYDFSRGYIQAGRIMPFNRWIMTSIDGGSLAFKLSKQIRTAVIAGNSVNYGPVFDDENTRMVAYADLAYQGGSYQVKLKYYHDDQADKAGTDFYGGLKKLRFNGNYGFDFTNSRMNDGGLNLSYPLNHNFLLTGNYLLFRSLDWGIANVEFNPYLIERFMLGARYLAKGYQIDFKQLAAMNSERTDYISFLTFSQKYINAGVNFLTGDSKMQRIGFTLGGNYAPVDDLMLSLGVSPVDHMFYDTSDHQFTTSVYFRAKYSFMKNFQAMVNFNYYDNNNALYASTRGGIRILYNFGS